MRRRWWILAAACALASIPLCCDLLVGASGAVHRTAAETPYSPVALVLGTSPTHDGRPNRFYTARLRAAAELYAAGAVDGLLVSGDNARTSYNEPDAMRADLVALGVPFEHVTCDYAGFRTLDSVVRAKEVFGLKRVTIVSQPFHAERALFIARHAELDAVAFGADDPMLSSWLKVRAREVAARSLAVFDLIVGTQPKFLGEPVHVTTRLR